MSIYSQISLNKTRTLLILVLFIFLFSGFFYLIGQYFQNPGSFLIFGLIFSLVSGVGSYFYSDKLVLFSTGAQPADKKKYFDFYTVAENMAIAAGLPMPRLYVMDSASPNAFATGRDPKHAVICVTTGLLQILDRGELEGVISHELSHVKNYDILLASIVAVLVGTLAFVSDWLMRSFWWGGLRSNDNERENRNPLVFIVLIVTLILTPITATLIQLAVSRRREYLADADGALLTRNPEGLASALVKISSSAQSLSASSPATAHLFISDPLRKKSKASWFAGLFNTHPPIEERVRLLRSM